MNKKKASASQIIPIVLFSIAFFICMIILLVLFTDVVFQYNQRKLSTRLEYAQANEKVVGTDSCLRDLISNSDYEKEFDSYWDFGKVRLAYVNARFGTQKEEDVDYIRQYLATNPSPARQKAAQTYLEKLGVAE